MHNTDNFKIFAVAGNPISHSMSPQIMNKAMEINDFNGHYLRLAADSAKEIIDVMKSLNLTGCNVTAPFKEEVFEYLNLYDARVQQIKCANTLLKKDANIIGYNTDVNGITLALKSIVDDDVSFQGASALIVGYGGAARAAAYTCKMMQMQTYVTGGDVLKIEKFSHETGCIPIEPSHIQDNINNADIIISTVPPETMLFHNITFSEGQIFLDCNYFNPLLRKKITSEKAQYISGLKWLFYQACPAFALFTNQEAPIDALRETVEHIPNPPKVVTVIASSDNLLEAVAAHLVDFDSCIFIHYQEDVGGSFRKLKKHIKKAGKSLSVALMTAYELEQKEIYNFVDSESYCIWMAEFEDMEQADNKHIAAIADLLLPVGKKTGGQLANRLRKEIENLFIFTKLEDPDE